MLSYWEREQFLKKPDFCIVGSGIVGLTTAIFLKRKYPDSEVVIVEKGFLPDGASTKNAGFCCFGSVSELVDDFAKWPKNEVLALAQKRFLGLDLLRLLIGDDFMKYEPFGGYEVFTTKNDFDKYMSFSSELNSEFNSLIAPNVYSDASTEISKFGFNGIAGMIRNNFEGQVDTGQMINSLMNLAKKEGVKIFFGLGVKSFESDSTGVNVLTQNDFNFTCRKLIVTTNGFAKQLLPELDVVPARAQVLITKPIENLKLKGSFHYDKGYYYFRNVGDRVLFGGGRNLDFDAETTYEAGLTALVQDKLSEILSTVILPYKKYEIDMRWSGIMGVGGEKKTIVKQVAENVFCGVRMGGMGVALGSLVGKELSELV
jgi:gamma-glutamylputrescine oxidase